DQQNDNDLEHDAPLYADVSLQQIVGLPHERLLLGDARLPRLNAETLHGLEVHAGDVEITDDLERVLDPLGELPELHDATKHRARQRGIRAAEGDDSLARLRGLLVDALQLRVEQAVVIAMLEELRRRELEDPGNVTTAAGFDDECAVPVDHHEVVLE